MVNIETFDLDRMEVMARAMMEAIKNNYAEGPASPNRVYEALNALACCAGTLIVGTGDRKGRRDARFFFDTAVENQVRGLLK